MKKIKYINENLDFANFDLKEVKNSSLKVQKILDADLDYFKKLKMKDYSFRNIFSKSDQFLAPAQRINGILNLFINIHTDPNVREVSRTESLVIVDMFTKHSYNQIIYEKVIAYYNNFFKLEKKSLTSEEIYIVEQSVKEYKKMGMHLPKKQKDELVKISSRISKLSSEYQLNCTKNYAKGLWFKKVELTGVSEDVIETFKYNEKKNKYFVSIRPTEILEVKKFCTVSDTRRRITEVAEKGVGEINNKKLREILLLRSKKSKILGFKTWGHLTMDSQMVNDPKSAIKFCTDLIKNLESKFNEEKKEAKSFLSYGEKIDTSNSLFLENLAQKKSVNLSPDDLKKYYEYESTIASMFLIWEKYFGVKVKFLRNLNEIDKDIAVYKCSDTKTGSDLGTIILDLFPRDGKYGHACVDLNSPRYVDENGDMHTALGTLICNFTKNAKGKTLISIENVATLFHEGGHLIHLILANNSYASTSAFSTSIDFVEIPSQFMEHFVMSDKTANMVAKNLDTGKGLDKKILEKIHKLDDYFVAKTWTHLCVLSLFDLTIHGKDILKYAQVKGEMNKLFEKLWVKYTKIKAGKDRDFSSAFAHLVGGYDSKYFGYGVSRVYAEDVWEEFISKSKMNDYKKMLQTGGMEKEEVMLKKFLGRSPKQNAFLKFVNK